MKMNLPRALAFVFFDILPGYNQANVCATLAEQDTSIYFRAIQLAANFGCNPREIQ